MIRRADKFSRWRAPPWKIPGYAPAGIPPPDRITVLLLPPGNRKVQHEKENFLMMIKDKRILMSLDPKI
jgi:hypothetical protein